MTTVFNSNGSSSIIFSINSLKFAIKIAKHSDDERNLSRTTLKMPYFSCLTQSKFLFILIFFAEFRSPYVCGAPMKTIDRSNTSPLKLNEKNQTIFEEFQSTNQTDDFTNLPPPSKDTQTTTTAHSNTEGGFNGPSLLPTDPYFISGLSDLLLENQEFDRIDNILLSPTNAADSVVVDVDDQTRLLTIEPTTIVENKTEKFMSPEATTVSIKTTTASTTTTTVARTTKTTKKEASGLIVNNNRVRDESISEFTTIGLVSSTSTSQTTTNIPFVVISTPTPPSPQQPQPPTPTPNLIILENSLPNSIQLNEKSTQDQSGNQTMTTSTTMATTTNDNNKQEIIDVEISDSLTPPKIALQPQQPSPFIPDQNNNNNNRQSDDLVKLIDEDDEEEDVDIVMSNNSEGIDVLDIGIDVGMIPARSINNNSSDEKSSGGYTGGKYFDDDEFIYPEIMDENLNKKLVDEEKERQSHHNEIPKTIDRDSDTIFYISNTEVKVVESIPTPDTRKPNKYYPDVYEEDVLIDFSNPNQQNGQNRSQQNMPDKFEEDIILSPLKNNFDPLKILDDNLSVSYVGESFIDIEESTNSATSSNPPTSSSQDSDHNGNDVIIEPVLIPDIPIAIGVPIIAELPPQIELKHMDYIDDLITSNLANKNNLNDDVTIRSHVLVHGGDSLVKNPLSADIRDEKKIVRKNDKIYQKRIPGTNTTELYVNGTAPFGEDEDVESGKSRLDL